MRGKGIRPYRLTFTVLALVAGIGLAGRSLAQELLKPDEDFQRESVLGHALAGNELTAPGPPPGGRVPRLHLFNMPSGFLYEPIGIDADDGTENDPNQPSAGAGVPSGPNGSVQVTLGMDNPYFDYRWRTEAGGIGYYLVDSQVQLLDQGSTCLCFGLQAVTPAGLEAGGVAEGPTVVRPSVAWFQEIGSATALQGFVAKRIQARSGWTENLETGFRYGVAFQYTVPWLSTGPNQSVQFFVEALGRYQKDAVSCPTQAPLLEFVPGIHWRVGDNWWISVGAARRTLVTCSWQF
jgi:hypothetical protein